MANVTLPAFLRQPEFQGIVSSFPIEKNYIGSSFFPQQSVASDEMLIRIEVPENPIAPFVTLDQEAPRDQEELITEMRQSLAYIRFKKVWQESQLRIFGVPEGLGIIGDMQTEARNKILRSIARLRQAVDSRLEWLAMQALTGTITYNDERIKFSLNFPGVYTGGSTSFVRWNNTATAKPAADLGRWIEEMGVQVGADPSRLLASRRVWRAMAAVDDVKNLFSLWRGGGTQGATVPGSGQPGNARTGGFRGPLDNMINDWFGVERIAYDNKITARTWDANGNPGIAYQNLISDKHLFILPDGPVGYMATSPNPIDFGGTGLYSWTQNHQDPWIVETGVGINAFPNMIYPEKIGYIQVLD